MDDATREAKYAEVRERSPELYELMHYDATVYAAIKTYMISGYGDTPAISWEEMLQKLVVMLAKEKDVVEHAYVDNLEYSICNPFIMKSTQ